MVKHNYDSVVHSAWRVFHQRYVVVVFHVYIEIMQNKDLVDCKSLGGFILTSSSHELNSFLIVASHIHLKQNDSEMCGEGNRADAFDEKLTNKGMPLLTEITAYTHQKS